MAKRRNQTLKRKVRRSKTRTYRKRKPHKKTRRRITLGKKRRKTLAKKRRRSKRKRTRRRKRQMRGGADGEEKGDADGEEKGDADADDGEVVTVLYYSGKITGSIELRNYNNAVVTKSYNQDSQKGTPIYYYKTYDKAKGRENFYDCFLMHLAHMDLENCDRAGLKSIKYYKEIIQDDEYNDNIGKISLLKTKITDEEVTREAMKYNEQNTKHIFIMSPMTNLMTEEIKEACNNAISSGGTENLVIHIQGDTMNHNYVGNESHPGYFEDNGLKGKESMFPDAFNLYSGGIAVQNLRKYFRHNKKVQVLSVSPVTSNGTKWRKKENEKGEVPDTCVPEYYKQVNNDILEANENNEGDRERFLDKISDDTKNYFIKKGLNVLKVYQDGIDKDNLASLILLEILNNQNKIDVDFIGTRLYSSTSIPIMAAASFGLIKGATPAQNKYITTNANVEVESTPFGKGQFGSSMAVTSTKMDRSEYDQYEGGKDPVKGLVAGVSDDNKEHEQPIDVRGSGYGNLPFDNTQQLISKTFYMELRARFEKILMRISPKITITRPLCDNVGDYIVDGLGLISQSRRAPFNYALYHLAKNTYAGDAIINTLAKIFKIKLQKDEFGYEKALLMIKAVTPEEATARQEQDSDWVKLNAPKKQAK